MTDVIEIFVNDEQYTSHETGQIQFKNIEVGEVIDEIVFYNHVNVGDVITIKVVG